MNLFEHQSTFNPNMPLRGMEYFAELYGIYITENGLDIYVSSLQKIPTPRYYVFYNGTEKHPDVVKLKLSDAFQVPDDSGEFEWTATMLNINYGHNRELLEQCQPLYEYAHFIKLVRAVSYTHLDVYRRQLLYFISDNSHRCDCIFINRIMSC